MALPSSELADVWLYHWLKSALLLVYFVLGDNRLYTILDHSTVSEPETNKWWGVISMPNIYILLQKQRERL